MKNRLALLVGVLVAAGSFLAAAPAHAQGYYSGPPQGGPPQGGVYRSGLVLGGGIGLGGIGFSDCDNCDALGSFGLQADIGGMVAPELAVVFDAAALYHVFEDDSLLTSATFLACLRGWLGRIIWLEGGLGIGYIQATDSSGFGIEESRGGPAGMIAGGIEILQSPHFVLDLQLRISAARFQSQGDAYGVTNAAIFLGFNWY